jgi:transposase-like protein
MVKQKVTKRYSEAIKREAVATIERGLYTKSQAAKMYGVYPNTISIWIKRVGKPQLLNKVIKVQMPEEIEAIKKLEEEKRKLETALAQAHLKIIALESTIKVLETESRTGLKKSTDIRLSNAVSDIQHLKPEVTA